jgi:hypothetical protein
MSRLAKGLGAGGLLCMPAAFAASSGTTTGVTDGQPGRPREYAVTVRRKF